MSTTSHRMGEVDDPQNHCCCFCNCHLETGNEVFESLPILELVVLEQMMRLLVTGVDLVCWRGP